MAELRYSFYDDLRLSPTASFAPLVKSVTDAGFPVVRNLHRAVDPDFGVPDPGVVLCHIPTFLRWTVLDEKALLGDFDPETLLFEPGEDSFKFKDLYDAYGESAAVLMAMQHFNNGVGSIAPELDGINETCSVRLTTELVDTMEMRSYAEYLLTLMLLERKPEDVVFPRMCALLGGSTSGVTEFIARTASNFGIPQVSPSASSPALDNILEFPSFARTHPSDAAMADKLVSYLKDELGVSFFGMLYVENAYGSGFREAAAQSARSLGMNLTAVPFKSSAHSDNIRNALTTLKETGLNYFFGVFYSDHYELIMSIANEIKVAGPGRYWIFAGSLTPELVDGSFLLEMDPMAQEVTAGNSILYTQGGLPGSQNYDEFVRQWRKLGHDLNALSYINSKQPLFKNFTFPQFEMSYNEIEKTKTKDFFLQNDPSSYAAYAYDAVVGLGLAACKAQHYVGTAARETFSGYDHFKTLVNTSFQGASSRVSFDELGSRDPDSTYFIVSNIRADGPSSTFRSVPVIYYNESTKAWTNHGNNSFLYPGNTHTPPAELQDVNEDLNQLHPATRAFCLLLSAIVICLSLGFIAFTVAKRKHRIIKASQPPFLILICIGTLLLASAIIPLSVDDGVATTRGCEIACASYPWLLFTGFCLSFSALFSKLWRINQVFKNARGFRKVRVTARDVIVPLIVLLGSNLIVLIVWTIESPATWERVAQDTNVLGQTTVSIGRCVSENGHIYHPILLVINGIAIFITLWQAYVARKIKTELSESKYIAVAVVCIFEATFIGIPILVIVQEQPTANLFIASGIIFVICLSLLLLLFVPKVKAMREAVISDTITPPPHHGRAYRADSQHTKRLEEEIQRLKEENRALKGEDED